MAAARLKAEEEARIKAEEEARLQGERTQAKEEARTMAEEQAKARVEARARAEESREAMLVTWAKAGSNKASGENEKKLKGLDPSRRQPSVLQGLNRQGDTVKAATHHSSAVIAATLTQARRPSAPPVPHLNLNSKMVSFITCGGGKIRALSTPAARKSGGAFTKSVDRRSTLSKSNLRCCHESFCSIAFTAEDLCGTWVRIGAVQAEPIQIRRGSISHVEVCHPKYGNEDALCTDQRIKYLGYTGQFDGRDTIVWEHGAEWCRVSR